ncbi:hypothetical protein EDD52_12133 [Primorskyibacter sedentarius]|uniref:Transposase n=1 Tax=Primorskyibacter sedentarius TaxID=745311 RepID=A0A4R3J2U3_9RHOB|nr:hypothetical protein EDD52_12133 [Primorskyibacter sedentarius]
MIGFNYTKIHFWREWLPCYERWCSLTYYQWFRENGGLKTNQVKRSKELEKENERLRMTGSYVTRERLILHEAASGNC